MAVGDLAIGTPRDELGHAGNEVQYAAAPIPTGEWDRPTVVLEAINWKTMSP